MADTFFKTYEAVGLREDLTDVITNISPTDTPMLSRFGRTPVMARYHEWQTDSLASAAANTVVEGNDPDAPALTPTVRTGNYTQIARKVWRVTDTMEAVDKAGRNSEYSYQMAKKMKELARDIEYALVNGTGNSGASGTAREVKGVLSFIATNVETGTGTGSEALTESMYNDLLQTIYDAGGNPDVTYANGWQKRKISAFSTPSTRNINAGDKKLVASVDVYESDFGLQTIILDRYMTTSVVAALEEDKWKVGFLRPVAHKRLPDNGGGPKGMVETEFTLESRNEAASGKITGLSTS
jgi:hypothetical protein